MEKGRLLTKEQQKTLHDTVNASFAEHNKDSNFRKARKGIEWTKVWEKLEANPEKMWSLNEMERTGGEPDVVGFDKKTGEYVFMDCSLESPAGRRNCCYNRAGQKEAEKRGEKPDGNAIDIAEAMGVSLLDEEGKKEYTEFQILGNFDRNTWGWLKTSEKIRKSGLALYGRNGEGITHVGRDDAYYHYDYGAFRASLRV